MNVKIAREKIEEVIKAGAERLSAAGLKTKVRSFYTDKNLAETEEFSPKVILLFGDVAFGYESMDFDDYCNYSICCEVKSAEVNEKELEDGIAEFNKEIDKVIEKVSSATSPESVIEEISKQQTEDAEIAAREFAKEMRKIKFKLYGAIGAIVVIIAAVLILIPMFT